MEIDRNGLEVLDRAECLRLLAGASLGRLGVTSGALPTVLPVNFRLVDDRVVFRTGVGSKLQAATHNTVVAFEVDEMDPVWHTGWSVVVTGVAREITDPDELAALEPTTIPHWAPDHATHLVEVRTEMMSGRRVRAGRVPSL
ncbi:MAG TPA: pyridoxamine 5'-phosphate oxidase family protein [Acidimicrobiales bacterium]|nr:pyridoxamine 5'-phosphate oxidase family protein [Acidimicrobiales bacterium]